jgi:hypothetical protein
VISYLVTLRSGLVVRCIAADFLEAHDFVQLYYGNGSVRGLRPFNDGDHFDVILPQGPAVLGRQKETK